MCTQIQLHAGRKKMAINPVAEIRSRCLGLRYKSIEPSGNAKFFNKGNDIQTYLQYMNSCVKSGPALRNKKGRKIP